MKKIIYLVFLIAIAACAKIPVQTLDLTDAIIDEGKRMHQLNLSFLNSMFAEKRDKIDLFISVEYTPKFLENFKKDIPPETDFQKEFPEMMMSIIPEINSRRNAMQSTLETQRIKLMTKLDADYRVFEEASAELRNLIASAVKVNEERSKAFEQLSNLTKNKVNLNQVENEIDEFISKSGEFGSNIKGDINELNSSIDSLINN